MPGDTLPKINRRALLAGSLALSGVSAGCNPFPNYTVKLALRVKALFGQKQIAGESIVQLDWYDNGIFKNIDAALNYTLKGTGDAITLRPMPALSIFALLRPPGNQPGLYAGSLPGILGSVEVMRTRRSRRFGPDLYQWLATQHDWISIPEREWPALAWFRDINDPKSVVLIRSGEVGEIFGQAISLTSFEAKATSDPVNYHIDNEIPWMSHWKNTLASDGRSGVMRMNPNIAAMSVNYLSFKLREDAISNVDSQ